MEGTAKNISYSASSAFMPDFISADAYRRTAPATLLIQFGRSPNVESPQKVATILVINGEMYTLQGGVPPTLASSPPGGSGLISIVGIANNQG